MKRVIVLSIAFFLFLSFSVFSFFMYNQNTALCKEKETLILKNDSLHMLQLKTKNELALFKLRIDSLINKGYKNSFTFKKRT